MQNRREFIRNLAYAGLGAMTLRPGKSRADVFNLEGNLKHIFTLDDVVDAQIQFYKDDFNFTSSTDIDGYYSNQLNTPVHSKPVVPENYQVFQNYPNPFNAATRIPIKVKNGADVNVEIYNSQGQVVENKTFGKQAQGNYTINWDPDNVAAGIYHARVRLDDEDYIIKMNLNDGAGRGTGLSMDNGAEIGQIDEAIRPLRIMANKNTGQGQTWKIKITHPDFYDRLDKQSLVQDNPNQYDQLLLPKDFRLELFDEITRRNYDGGTKRWSKYKPYLFIVDGPLDGHDEFETPSDEQVNMVIDVWKNIVNPAVENYIDTDQISIRNFNVPNKEIYEGGIIPSNGYTVVFWNKDIPGWGAHSERYDPDAHPLNYGGGGVDITAASAELNPWREPYSNEKSVAIEELIQTMGFPTDPWKHGNKGDLYLGKGKGINDLFKQFAKYAYSRPVGTKSPDNSLERIDVA